LLYVVDDEPSIGELVRRIGEGAGLAVEFFLDGESFLAAYRPNSNACLVLDLKLPGIDGLELASRLRRRGDQLPIVIVTAYGNIFSAALARALGCVNFLSKPFRRDQLLAAVRRALGERRPADPFADANLHRLACLSDRERQILAAVLDGATSKEIADFLGIGIASVCTYRRRIIKRFGVRNLEQVVARLFSAKTWPDQPP
jgi:FixJ family two-component response regulator